MSVTVFRSKDQVLIKLVGCKPEVIAHDEGMDIILDTDTAAKISGAISALFAEVVGVPVLTNNAAATSETRREATQVYRQKPNRLGRIIHRWTDEERADVIARYLKGEVRSYIGRRFGVSAGAISQIIYAAGAANRSPETAARMRGKRAFNALAFRPGEPGVDRAHGQKIETKCPRRQ